MLHHLAAEPAKPRRVVVIGAGGFVGGAVCRRLEAEGIEVLALDRAKIDLLAEDAATRLSSSLRPGDAVVAAAARAPCRNLDMMIENVVMVRSMLAGIAAASVSHVVNISSDAVYADEPTPITEETPTAPATLHGAMHLMREIAFREAVAAPLAILRPTLLYGAEDPHNGYGPNRFRRSAAAGEDIVLFGGGEERRDHVLIDDLAEVVLRVLQRRSTGVLNVAAGRVHSFRAIAEMVAHASSRDVALKETPRSGPMPHNGYRPFDIAATRKAFPDFEYSPIESSIGRLQELTERSLG